MSTIIKTVIHKSQITRHNTTKLTLWPNVAIYSKCVTLLLNASSETGTYF